MTLARRLFLMLALASVPVIAGCNSTTSIPTSPTPPPAPQRVYVSDDAVASNISIFTTPLSNASVTSGSFPTLGNESSGIKFDGAGNLYVASYTSGTVTIFFKPVSSASTPSVTISGLAGAEDVAFDGGGNLYVADTAGVAVIQPPFSTGTYPFAGNFTVASAALASGVAINGGDLYVTHSSGNIQQFVLKGLGAASTEASHFAGGRWGIAFDGAGNLYAADSIGHVEIFTPMAVTTTLGAPIVHNVAPQPATPASMANIGVGSVLMIDAGANQESVTVTSVTPTTFTAIFTIDHAIGAAIAAAPAFNSASTPSSVITLPAGSASYLAFDFAGNLYVTNGATSLYVYAPPFSAASVPVATVTIPVRAWGVGVGQ